MSFSPASMAPVDPAETPVQATGARPRSDSLLARAARSISRSITNYFGSPVSPHVVGRTPPATLREVAEDLRFGYKTHGLDRYHAVEKIAESTEGVIYLIKSEQSGKLYAMKHTLAVKHIRHEHRRPDDTATHRYPNEALMLRKYLHPHPNVVSLLEVCVDRIDLGRYRLYMEFCDGGNLYDQMDHWYTKRRSPVPEVFILHFIVEMFQALAYVHHGLRYDESTKKWTHDQGHQPIIHGDMKDENIFLRWREPTVGGLPDVVLGDFGTAKLESDKNSVCNPGTPLFHAPEDKAIYGDAEATAANMHLFLDVVNKRVIASDVYGLGQIIYMMTAKARDPLAIGTDPSTIQISKEYQTPGLRELIVRCMSINPKERAEASFKEGAGVLPVVADMREARNEMIRSRWPLDPLDFAHPPPSKRRR